MTKTALLQCADTGPAESLIIMLQSVGYRCVFPDWSINNRLRQIGCDTVLEIGNLVKDMGYEQPMKLDKLSLTEMAKVDLFVDIKAHRNGPKIWAEWPRLRDKTLWYRINGGKPEHVINDRGDHGDEVNPPCPILTPNLWYRDTYVASSEPSGSTPAPWINKAYAMWPPFHRFDEHAVKNTRIKGYAAEYDLPICLIHNLQGWGYGALVDNMRDLGVKCFGAGSPDGLIPHDKVAKRLSRSLAMVHLKSSDAPGYALYEALAAGCPVVCTRRLIWRNRMQELLIPGKTCLVFDRETHDGLTEQDVRECTKEVKEHLDTLAHPAINKQIGMAGRRKLKELMWNPEKTSDMESLKVFMEKHFGQ